MRSLATSLALSALALSASAQQTWTVDDDGPADFANVKDAVAAASDGDTIVVKAGFYQLQVLIDGKGLTLQADGDATLTVALAQVPTLVIRNLAADQQVYVRGFVVNAFANFETTTTVVESCAAPVLFEDCLISGGGTPVFVNQCASVAFSRCDLISPPTFANYGAFSFFGFAAYPGLSARDSTVFVYDSTVAGSNGGNSFDDIFIEIPPAPSGWGALLVGSKLRASGSRFTGGKGGGDLIGLCYAGEDGSPGIELSGSTTPSYAELIDCVVTGGTGGAGGCALGDGVDAPAILAGPSDEVVQLPGAARSFSGDSPAVEGSTVGVHLAGEPGDVVILHVQLDAAAGLLLPQFALAFHLPLPTAVVGLGAIPAGGQLDIPIQTPTLSPGIDSFRFVGQALFVGASGFFEGGPSTLLMVDAAL